MISRTARSAIRAGEDKVGLAVTLYESVSLALGGCLPSLLAGLGSERAKRGRGAELILSFPFSLLPSPLPTPSLPLPLSFSTLLRPSSLSLSLSPALTPVPLNTPNAPRRSTATSAASTPLSPPPRTPYSSVCEQALSHQTTLRTLVPHTKPGGLPPLSAWEQQQGQGWAWEK